MDWAKKIPAFFHPRIPKSERQKLGLLSFCFALTRDYYLKFLKELHFKLPKKARKGRTYLETITDMYPETMDEIKHVPTYMAMRDLFQARERLIHLTLKYYLQALDRFFRHRLHRGVKELIQQVPELYNEIIFSIASGFDRMRTDEKALSEEWALRMDFLISRMTRFVSKYRQIYEKLYSITSGHFDDTAPGETNLDFLSSSLVAEECISGGAICMADPALIMEVKDYVQKKKKFRLRIKRK